MSEVDLIALIVAIVMILGAVAFSVRRWRKGKDMVVATIRPVTSDVWMSNKELEALTAAFDASGFYVVSFEKFDGEVNVYRMIICCKQDEHARLNVLVRDADSNGWRLIHFEQGRSSKKREYMLHIIRATKYMEEPV